MKASNHEIFTRNAIDLYLEHVGQDAGACLTANREVVERHSEVEDFSPVLTRMYNWHFYRSNDDIDEPHQLSRTSERRLSALLEKFDESVESGFSLQNCYEWVGRILHHIQDMSCPAHVMPIYHVKVITDNRPDSLEVFFDDYIDSLGVPYDSNTISAACIAECPGSIYDNAATRTLNIVANHSIEGLDNGVVTELPLKKFWLPYGDAGAKCTDPNFAVEYEGFTTYGEYNNNFGRLEFRVGANNYEVSATAYKEFYAQIYQTAVLDSVRALHTLEQKLLGREFVHGLVNGGTSY